MPGCSSCVCSVQSLNAAFTDGRVQSVVAMLLMFTPLSPAVFCVVSNALHCQYKLLFKQDAALQFLWVLLVLSLVYFAVVVAALVFQTKMTYNLEGHDEPEAKQDLETSANLWYGALGCWGAVFILLCIWLSQTRQVNPSLGLRFVNVKNKI